MEIESIYHAGFVVSDIERSLKWYTEVLGLQIERPIRELEGEWISMVTGYESTRMRMVWLGTGGNCSIELNQYIEPEGSSGPNNRERKDVGAAHIGMQVDDVNEWYARLSAQGVKFAGPPPPKLQNVKFPWARCAVQLQDPDGNWLELLEHPKPDVDG